MVIKKIIVLSGVSQVGKTTTLQKLARSINGAPGVVVVDSTSDLSVSSSSDRDDKYCFDFLQNGKSVKVGISTAGDSPWHIEEGFAYFRSYQCEVGFIASKSCGQTIGQIEIESAKEGVVPQYMHMMNETEVRSRSVIQNDIVTQLVNLI